MAARHVRPPHALTTPHHPAGAQLRVQVAPSRGCRRRPSFPDSAALVDLVAVTPKKVAGLAVVSKEAVGDANAAEMLGQALARVVAVKVDGAFFRGGGANGPAGLQGVTGATTIAADPTAGLAPWIDAYAAIESAGGMATVGFASPNTWASLAKVKETAGSSKPVLAWPIRRPVRPARRRGRLVTSRSSFPLPFPTARHASSTAPASAPSSVSMARSRWTSRRASPRTRRSSA